MAGVTFRIDIDDAAVRDGLRDLRAAAADLTPAMTEIGVAMVANTLFRFEDEEAPDGTPWQASIRAIATGGKTLTDRGHLRDSITFRAEPDAVTVGSNVRYARIHQQGGTIQAKTARGLIFRLPAGAGANKPEFRRKQSVTLPARPYLGVSAADQEDITDALRRHLEGLE